MEAKTKIQKDPANKKMLITRNFAAPVAQVWAAWTDSKLLDKWWAPKPWKARTKTMDFKEGGFWLYAMVGPEGAEHWARIDYHAIKPQDFFTATDSFCDANGVKSTDFPSMEWKNTFHKTDQGTKVEVEIKFAQEADMQKLIEMGFEQGFSMAHDNLDELLAQ